MLAEAQRIIQSSGNPDNFGDRSYVGDVLEVWQWAETTGRMEILAAIAQIYPSGKRNREWKSKIEVLAAQTKSEGRWKEYVGFLEGLLPLEWNKTRLSILLEEICDVYSRLGDQHRVAWYMWEIATIHLSLGELAKAQRALLESYRLSRDARYTKGIGMALMGLGELLAAQGKYLEACRFLYQARQVLIEARSNFAISAKEALSDAKWIGQLTESQYKTAASPDELIMDFRKTYASGDR